MKNKYYKPIISVLIASVFLVFAAASGEYDNSTETTTSNPNYEETIEKEPEKKDCHHCEGTGMITCSSCGGTGINNMGIDCICVTYVVNSRKMGKEPQRTALRWTCEYCNGTGKKNKNSRY